jgi:hypothetical protein
MANEICASAVAFNGGKSLSAHARHIQESMFLFDWMKKRPAQQVPASTDQVTASQDALSA